MAEDSTFPSHPSRGGFNQQWWPHRLNLRLLAKNSAEAAPLGQDVEYATAFESLDLTTVKKDIAEILAIPQDWCPDDFGNYRPLMVRVSWQVAGTYRVEDGRGGAGSGQQRFAPLSSWVDNVTLDKARRLLWPVKRRYGESISWADLIVLSGNVALEAMDCKTFGFAGGRIDAWEPDDDSHWGKHDAEGPETAIDPLGLNDVDPEGLQGDPDPIATARDIRETSTRMGMNDEETVALIAGALYSGKTRGTGANSIIGPEELDAVPRREPRVLTPDPTLRSDPIYGPITARFEENPEELADAFARVWFKLTHRDMGPIARYLGPEVPHEELIWQDRVPAADYVQVDASRIADLKERVRASGLAVSQLVSTAWAAASCFRVSDKRGGANGARIRLEPQRNWEVNDPKRLDEVLRALEAIQDDFNATQTDGTQISLADLIVLGGGVGVEQAAEAGGRTVEVPFTPGRTDATQEQTDADWFAALEPRWDGFRNYDRPDNPRPGEHLLVDKASQLSLTAPEMTVLVGGLRVLGANTDDSDVGVLTSRVGTLSNDYFANLLDIATTWSPIDDTDTFAGVGPSGQEWTGARADLVFSSNAELRAVAEVYASADSADKFVDDFVRAWAKVMNLDRYDVQR